MRMDEDKFQIRVEKDRVIVVDVETGRQLDMNDKYHVKQLVTLLNDWHKIILDKWGLK